MKKILTILILALSASVIFMSACGNADSDSKETAGKVELSNTQSSKEESSKISSSEESSKAESSKAEVKEESSEKASSKPESSDKKTAESKSESSRETSNKEPSKQESKAETKPQEKKTESSAESKKPIESSKSEIKASYSDSDAALIYKNTTITVGKEFQSEKIGSPDSKQENANCLLGTSGYTYIYGPLTINVYTENNKEYVEGILLDGKANVSTTKNIKQGSTVDDLKKVYGNPSAKDDMMYSYDGTSTKMVFYIENGKVSSMYISKNM